MYKSILIFIFSLCALIINAQIQITDNGGYIGSHLNKSEIITGDVDADGILDSLYYDFNTESLKVLLSSKNFNVLSISYAPFCMSSIDVKQNYVSIDESCMRYTSHSLYQYDKKRDDFRLINFSDDAFGNAFHDGSGTCEFDLLSGDFTANWNYYDFELDSLISIPTIREKVTISPIYLNDSIYISIPTDSLFPHYQSLNMIRTRIDKIDLCKLLSTQNEQFIDFEKDNITSLKYLINKYGEPLCSYLKPPFKANLDNDCNYSNRIVHWFTLNNMHVYIISFDFKIEDISYVILWLDKKSIKISTKHIIDNPDIKQLYQSTISELTIF